MTSEFEKLFSWGGTPQAECGCGRVHYAQDGHCMEPGELAGLEARRKKNPDRYVPTTDDSVSITDVFGVTYVWDCPCQWAEKMERHLWARRIPIMKYFTARSQRGAKESAETIAAISAASETKGTA